MARYPQGQPVRVDTTVRDDTGALVDAGSIKLTLHRPDGTALPDYTTPTRDSLGTYHQVVPAGDFVTLGTYPGAWFVTGAGAGVSRPVLITVVDPFEIELLSLPEVKTHLGIKTTDYDGELQLFIDSAVSSIERHLGGPAVIRTVVETVEPTDSMRALPLTYRPFVSLTGITANGVTVGISDVYATPGRVLRRRFGLPFLPFWQPPWVVTYKAGLDTAAPPSVVLAGKLIIQNLWTTRRGPVTTPGGGMDTVMLPGWGYAVPARAAELLDAYAPETGLA
jgi:hypothetical protein